MSSRSQTFNVGHMKVSFNLLSRGEGKAQFEWLKIREGKHTKNPQNYRNFQIISHLFPKRGIAQYLFVCNCQENIKVDGAVCEFDQCKTTKVRVGQILNLGLSFHFRTSRKIICNILL